MSDFNVPGSRPKKHDEISETDRSRQICTQLAVHERTRLGHRFGASFPLSRIVMNWIEQD